MTSAWTPERIEQLLVLSEQKLTYPEIARQLGGGATEMSVAGKLYRLRNTPDHLSARYTTWSEDEVNTLRSMARRNKTSADIGRALNRDASAVRKKAHKLHIAVRRCPIEEKPSTKRRKPPEEYLPAVPFWQREEVIRMDRRATIRMARFHRRLAVPEVIAELNAAAAV